MVIYEQQKIDGIRDFPIFKKQDSIKKKIDYVNNNSGNRRC